jgi:four helix bundle protein
MTISVQEIGYKKLVVYQKSKSLVLNIYRLTAKYPKIETYTLVPQMRRASVSVLANLVEGYSKESPKEYSRFLTISIGSLTELEVFLEISFELNYINKVELDRMNMLVNEVKRPLYGSRKKARAQFV